MQLTQEAKIASDFPYIRAIFAVVGFVSALKRLRERPGGASHRQTSRKKSGLCGEQGRRPVFPAKEAAERAFAPRPWEEIVELFQRPVPGLYKRAAMSEIQASFGWSRQSRRRYY